MRNTLFCLITSVALNAYSSIGYGQSSTSNQPTNKISAPLYIINSNIIGNGLINTLDPNKVKEVVVYKGQDGPKGLNNLSSSGILAITYDGQIGSKSFAEIGLKQGLHGPLRFVLNGRKLDAAQVASLRIAPEAIGQLHITPAASVSSETTVTIQLTEAKTDSKKKAPGTIMVR